MRRRRAFKRGRVLSIVVAGFAGYVLGGWNGSAPRSPELSAAQAVALRFPQDLDDTAAGTAATIMSNVRLALLSPEPMIPQASAAPVQQASAPALAPAQTVPPMAAVAALPQAAPARPSMVKPVAIVHRRDD